MTESSPPVGDEASLQEQNEEQYERISYDEISKLAALENGLEFQIAIDSLATGNLEPLRQHLARLEGLDPNTTKIVSSKFELKNLPSGSKVSYVGELDQIGEPGSDITSRIALPPRMVFDLPDEAYEYQALRSELNEIRLLRLGPKDENGAYHGLEISTFSLEAAPNFYALSYVWGNPEKVLLLPCNGKKVMITQNLSHAIYRIFQRFPETWVWADGICINQEDIIERGLQVQIMGRIYSKATLVVAHPGDYQNELIEKPGEGSAEQEAIGAKLEELQLNKDRMDDELQHSIPTVSPEDENASVISTEDDGSAQSAISLMNYLSRLWSFEDDYSLNKSIDWSQHPLPETQRLWERLFVFWEEQWFYRSWILQEAVLGKKVVLLVEDTACSLDFVMQFWERAKKRDTPEILRHGLLADRYVRLLHVSPVTTMKVLRDSKHPQSQTIQQVDDESVEKLEEDASDIVEDESKSRLLDLLALSRIYQASDLRDKIYSLLSLASVDPLAQSIIPNYSSNNTVTLLYQEVAKKIVNAKLGPELLHYSGIDHTIPNLPSWAPDWSHQSRSTLPFHLYSASGSSIPHFSFSKSHPQKLKIRGVALDTMRWNAIPWRYYDPLGSEEKGKFAPLKESPDREFPPFSDEDCRCLIRDVAKHGQTEYATIYNDEEPDIALARTLVCDTTWRGLRTSSDLTFQESWEAFESLYSMGPDESTPKDARIYSSGIFDWVRDHISPEEEADLKRKSWPLEVAIQNSHKGRRFCVTSENGWMCTAPYNAERGDVLVLFEGCKTPFLLREEEKGKDFTIVGDVYVHGIMDGEVIVKVQEGEVGDDEVSVDGNGERFAVRIGEGHYGQFRDFRIR